LQHPHLTIIAGCNGAGKSTYSASLVKGGDPFDYDKRYLEIYQSLRDSEFREQFALNQVTEELNNKIKNSFLEKKSFCFETNLHVFPKNWIQEAKQNGFIIDLHFFCLESIEQAKQRVYTRTRNNGHFVDDSTIEYKWREGYKNFNLYYSEFDKIIVIDNSKNNLPTVLFEMKKNTENDYEILIPSDKVTEYIQRRLPAIFELLKTT
jgi:predicted ABC-type ATPase